MEQTELLGSKAEKRQFRRMVMALVVPMALQNLINVAVNAADVIMLGKVSETALSGASLAGQVQFYHDPDLLWHHLRRCSADGAVLGKGKYGCH